MAGQVWPAGRSDVRHVSFRSDDGGASVATDNASKAAEGAFNQKWPSLQQAVTTFKEHQGTKAFEHDLEHKSLSQWQPAVMQPEIPLMTTLGEDTQQPQTLNVSGLVWGGQTAPEIGANLSEQAAVQPSVSLAWSQAVHSARQEDLQLIGPPSPQLLSLSPPADLLTPPGCMRKGKGGVRGSQASLQHSDWNNRTVTMPKQLQRAATPAISTVPAPVLDYYSRLLAVAPLHFVW